MQLIITWITAAALFLSALFAPAPAADEGPAAAVPAFQETESAALPAARTDGHAIGAAHADMDYQDIPYEHYDPDWFYEDTDWMAERALSGDAEGVNDMYDRLYDAFCYLDTLYTVAMIRHETDINDEYWSEEYSWSESLWTEMGDALSTAAAQVLDSPVAGAFRAHIGEAAADAYADYTPMTEAQSAAADRELELVEEYYSLMDTMGELSYEYRGKTWTFDSFSGFQGTNLYRSDYEGYRAVYDGLNRALLDAAAPIYIELCSLWADEARDAGYDSYADYAYENIYGRDYTSEQAQIFCDAVKPIAREYYMDLYYSDLFGAVEEIGGEMDLQARFDAMARYLPEIDESLLEPWEYMTAHGLYDIAPASAGRLDGAYTTAFSYYGAPFIFETEEGGSYDFQTLSHEFGHYTDAYFNPCPDVLNSVGSMDLMEIHSNGLQALLTAFYPDIFGSGAQAAAFLNIADLLENVIDGCIFDEFQRRVMADSRSLTADRLNELYLEVCVEYGYYDSDDLPDCDAGWCYVSHQFESPMYYVSYAASGFAALQLWDLAQSDFDGAVAAYLSILHAGAYEDGYLTVLKNSGLRTFDEEGAVQEVLEPVLKRLDTMEWFGQSVLNY